VDIRIEQLTDFAAIHTVNSTPCETSAEADLVNVLRGAASPLVSLIAEERATVVGHSRQGWLQLILLTARSTSDRGVGVGKGSFLPVGFGSRTSQDPRRSPT